MPRIFLLICLLPALCLADPADVAGEAAEMRQWRSDFLAAERSLRSGDLDRYRALAAGLIDYPLYPYLRYEYLYPRLGGVADEEVAEFVRRYADSPLGARLQNAWLDTLARGGRWQTLLRHYPADTGDAEMDCYRRWGLLQSGNRAAAFDGLERLWLVDHSQPAACDRVFSLWQRQGLLDAGLAWQRFVLAMNNNELQLARYLVRLLDPARRADAEWWLRVHDQPRLIESSAPPAADSTTRNAILIYGIKRLARSDIDRAVTTWTRSVSVRYAFTPEETAEVQRSLGMALALRGRKEAMTWLALVDAGAADATLREWRVRAAISQQDWTAALAAIYRLTEEEQATPRWRYWQARALEELNQQQQADEIFIALALNRSYYSFLAADRLGRAYQLNHVPVDEAIARSVTPEEYPGVARARELFRLDRLVDARREWYYVTRDMADWQLQSAALLAQSWGWHDRAIITMGRSAQMNDMELRFPLVHRDQVLAEARARGVDPALAFAVIRQESAFARDARSSAGALGLMQLMPQTARKLAGHLNLPSGRMDLLDVSTNLQLGIAYLRRLIDRYNNPLVAAAAYNAGVNRVNQWLPQGDIERADLWAETVPFTETRNYIQNVIYFASIYDQRLGLPPRKLSERMPPVIPLDTRLSRDEPGAAKQTEGEPGAEASS